MKHRKRIHSHSIAKLKDSLESKFQSALSSHQRGEFIIAKNLYLEILATNPTHFDALQLSAMLAYQVGQVDESEALFLKAISIKADFAPLFSNYGLLLKDQNRHDEALESYDIAISLASDYADAYYNQGNLLYDIARYEKALVSFDKAISINRSYAHAYTNRGNTLKALVRFREALESYDAAIELAPSQAETFYNRGIVLQALKRFDEAILSFHESIKIKPDYAEAYNNLGNTLKEIQCLSEAISAFDMAIFIKPNDAVAYNNRGVVLHAQKRFNLAIDSYDHAIIIDPKYASAYNNRGVTFKDLNRYDDAIASLDIAIDLQPDYADAVYNRGNALKDLLRLNEAISNYDKAISISSGHVEAHYNRGNTLKELKRFDDARASLRRVVEIETKINERNQEAIEWFEHFTSIEFIPAGFESEAELERVRIELDAKLSRCLNSFPVIEQMRNGIDACLKRFVFGMDGFYIAYLQKNIVNTMLDYSQLVSRVLCIQNIAPNLRSRPPGKIRLGIASSLLRSHNGSKWAYNWLANLPPDYDFFTYAFNDETDEVTKKFSELGTHRALVFDKENFMQTIETMRGDNLDILMLPDVGMTAASRILSCYRVAPVQFTAWGHPVTTGSPNIDYYLSSDLMEPEDAQSHYSERLVRLPNLALFITPPAKLASRGETFDLPEGRVLFGCLQSIFKYLPQYDFIYSRIAKAVPNAMFVFLEGQPSYTSDVLRRRLAREFEQQGLDYNDYVKFMSRVNPSSYIELLAKMDIILDSVGWTGGNTSLQAIDLGKPIITLPGEFMRGRHTYAMLRMMGLEKYAATSIDDYVFKAIRFGADRNLRLQFQSELLDRKGLLYEDREFIAALDGFLKSVSSRQLAAHDDGAKQEQQDVYEINIEMVDGASRSFRHRGTHADLGVLEQIFKNQDYSIKRLRRCDDIHNQYRAILDSGKKPLIVDAGSNIGASVVWFSLSFPGSHILGFEPDIMNYNLLVSNSSGLDVELHNAAVGCEDGMVSIIDPGEGEWGYRTTLCEQGSCGLLSLGRIIGEKIDEGYVPLILKIDIEGGEQNLFEGGTDSFQEFPLLIIELHDWLLPKQGTSRNFLKWAAAFDRDFVHIGENIFSIKA